jgi:ketosteroid isomerase-like protein
MKQLLPIILLVSLLSACSTEDGDAKEADIRAEALKDTFFRLNEAATSGDREGYQNLFLPDGVMFLPDRPPLLGREAIGRWAEEFMRSVVLVTDKYEQVPPLLGREAIGRWAEEFMRSVVLVTDKYEQVQIDIVGDVAIVRSRGSGRYILKKTGEEFPLHNKFIDILRYIDGEWLFSHHLASSSSLEPGLWDLQWESESVLPD